MSTTVGEYLSSLRHQHGWTLREASEKAGVSHSYLSQVERGKIKQPSPNILHKLAMAYGADCQTLMAAAGYIQESGNLDSLVIFRGAEHLTQEQKRLIQQLINNMVRREQEVISG